MAKFSYEQLSDAKLQSVFLRDAACLAMFGDRNDRKRHCDDVLDHLGKLATALGYLIEPITADAASKPEARSEAGSEAGLAIPPTSSARGGFAVEGQ